MPLSTRPDRQELGSTMPVADVPVTTTKMMELPKNKTSPEDIRSALPPPLPPGGAVDAPGVPDRAPGAGAEGFSTI